MCTGKCAHCIACTLYPLVLLCMVCNTVLFFPGWDVKYVKDGHITEEVKYLGGIVGGGVLVLIAALYIQITGEQGCCANRFGMFLSVLLAAVGVAGALYSFIVALLGLHSGPFCYNGTIWMKPFINSNFTYLTDYNSWSQCKEPKNVIQFNIGLFGTLMAASCLQVLLCAAQLINGLVGCLCGTCNNKESP